MRQSFVYKHARDGSAHKLSLKNHLAVKFQEYRDNVKVCLWHTGTQKKSQFKLMSENTFKS